MGGPLGPQKLPGLLRHYLTRQVAPLQAGEPAGLPTDRPEPLVQLYRQTQSLLGASDGIRRLGQLLMPPFRLLESSSDHLGLSRHRCP